MSMLMLNKYMLEKMMLIYMLKPPVEGNDVKEGGNDVSADVEGKGIW